VFDEAQAAAELPTLRAMAAADLHNLVFQLGGDVRIIPAVQAQHKLPAPGCSIVLTARAEAGPVESVLYRLGVTVYWVREDSSVTYGEFSAQLG
jgi:hypothetical protein